MTSSNTPLACLCFNWTGNYQKRSEICFMADVSHSDQNHGPGGLAPERLQSTVGGLARQEIVVTAIGASSLVYEFTTDLALPAHDLGTGRSGGLGFLPSAPR